MSDFKKITNQIKNTSNPGKSFEVFCKWFLENDPYWKTQVEKVWLWDDWPERWDIDKGIDLSLLELSRNFTQNQHLDFRSQVLEKRGFRTSTSFDQEVADLINFCEINFKTESNS